MLKVNNEKGIEDCIRFWCKENKVSASQYHYWINKLYKEENCDDIKWTKVTLETQNNKTIDENLIILHFHGDKIEVPKETIGEVLAAIALIF